MSTPEGISERWKAHFFSLWTGQAVSLFGSSLVQFALVWWLTDTTRSGTVLAMASLAALLPNILLGPLAGVLVDRWNRRLVMIAADSLVALVTVGLALLFAAGLVQVWHVYLALLLRAAAGSFQFPAMRASTSLMVPPEQLSRVAGFNQTLQGGMNIIAPPIGALLLQTLPLQGVLAIDVVTAVLGITPLFFIRIPQPPASTAAGAGVGAAKPSFLGELKAGLRYVANWPGLMGIILMAMIINFLFGPAAALLPILVTEHFQGGVVQLAAINSVFGIGVVAGGLILGVWGGFRRRIYTSLMGLTGLGLGFLLVGATPGSMFWLAAVFMLLAAVMQPLTNGPLMAVLQVAVAPEMQGRVFSLLTSLATAIMPLSLLVAGPVTDAIGVRAWYLLSGTVCAALGVGAFFVPAIVRMEENRGTAQQAPGRLSIDEASAPVGD